MATLNGERFLSQQLESLAAQTVKPRELVVSDDGSTDGTIAMIRAFAARSPFPVILNQNPTRLGIGDNFLRAAALTRGRWIAFCDQDDIWESRKLSVVAAAAARDAEILLVLHPSRLLRDGAITPEVVGPRAEATHPPLTLPLLQVYYGHSLVFDRVLLDILPAAQRPFSVHAPDRRMPHDDWISVLAASLGKSHVIGEPLVQYRMHADNASPAASRRFGLREALLHRPMINDAFLERQTAAAADLARQMQSVILSPPFIRENAARAASWYQAIAALQQRRLELWRANNFMRQLAILLGLIRYGAYRASARGGLGPHEGLKDAIFGVLLPRLPPSA